MTGIWKRIRWCREEVEALRPAAQSERWERLIRELGEACREGKHHEDEREALFREVTLVLSCTRTRHVLELVMDAVVRLSGAERGFLVLSRADGTQEVAAARNMKREAVEGAASQISRRVVSKVLSDGQSVLLEDALHTPPFSLAESVTRLKLLSVLCVPLFAEGSVIGALYLENRNVSGVFTEESERLIREFGSRIGSGIRNAESLENLRRSRDELQAALARDYEFEGVVGNSPAFREVLQTLSIAAGGDIPIVIEGESGTGEELLACVVHRQSPRSKGPFISLNCAALPPTLLESELFGHTRGAFTGAVRERRGLFATADGGTLFLDEIAEMAPEVQAKLLRVLQSGEYRPVGSDRVLQADVRIVAATRRSLSADVKAGRFREDLFFRLNGLLVRVPPLRKRKEDIPLLIKRFLDEFQPPGERLSLEKNALACLLAYEYPGNVRELETVIRRAVLFASDGTIGVDALPEEIAMPRGQTLQLAVSVPATGEELLRSKEQVKRKAVAEVERAFLIRALAAADGRPGEAALKAGMNRSQFARMLSRHGLSKSSPRSDRVPER